MKRLERRARGLPLRAERVKHPGHAVEGRLTGRDAGWAHVPPCDRHPESGASLAARASRGGEAGDPAASLAVIALREVERDGGERAAKLVFKVAVTPPKRLDNRPKGLDGRDGEVKGNESWCAFSCLHAPTSEGTVTAPKERSE